MNNSDLFRQDGVQTYLRDVADHRLLSREEEVELFQRLESGDEAAREEIVKCNLRLVIKIAMQFRGFGMPLADLIQEGNIGLLHVISKFDWRKGFRFSTYAAFWIRQEMQAALRSQSTIMRLPVRKARLLGKISETIKHISKMEGREPDAQEIAEFLGADLETVKMLLPLRESTVSLDADMTGEGASLYQTLADTAPAPYERLDEEQLSNTVRSALRYLTDKERTIVEYRFGLREGGSAMSLRKTSRKVGLSQEGVRRIEQRAISKLSRPAIKSQLEGLLLTA